MIPSVRDMSPLSLKSFRLFLLDGSEIKGTLRGKSEDEEMMLTWTCRVSAYLALAGFRFWDSTLSPSYLVFHVYSHSQLMKAHFFFTLPLSACEVGCYPMQAVLDATTVLRSASK